MYKQQTQVFLGNLDQFQNNQSNNNQHPKTIMEAQDDKQTGKNGLNKTCNMKQ